MKKKFIKILKKISFTNFFFFVLSIISTTFAWFAYSNIVNNNLSVNVKAWNISITDGDTEVSNTFSIEIDDIYPGSQLQSGDILISNSGDLSAHVTYRVKELRLFDTNIDVSSNDVINDLAIDYPFTFNFNLESDILNPGENTNFNYSVDWPMDSGNNDLDSLWGNNAAAFIANEESLHAANADYEIRSGINIVIELTVEQNTDNLVNTKDFGTTKYLNSVTNEECSSGTDNCLLYYKMATDSNGTFYIGDVNTNYENTLGTSLNNYLNIPSLDNILSVVKNDIYNSKFIINNYSDRIIGNVDNIGLYNSKLTTLKNNNGYIQFSKSQYYFLQSSTCYWLNTSYDSTHNFAIKNVDNNSIKIYPESLTNSCKAVSIIYVSNSSN